MSGGTDPYEGPQSAVLQSSSRTSLHHQRRTSTSERIEQILENARERADSIAAESASPAGRGSPRRNGSRTSLSLGDGEVDETTAILSERLSNYNSIQSDGDGIPRKRGAALGATQSSILDGTTQPPRESDEEREEERRQAAATGSAKHSINWLEKSISPFRSIELENKGSVARDHLALERTFLAWLRTSLAFASIGIAVTQLFRLNSSLPDNGNEINQDTLRQVGKPLGAAFLILSIMILLLGYRRYLQGQKWIIRGKFPASRGTVIAVVFVALAIMILSLVVVIVIHPKTV